MTELIEALECVDATLKQYEPTADQQLPATEVVAASLPVILAVSGQQPDGVQLLWSRTPVIMLCCHVSMSSALDISDELRGAALDALCNLSAESEQDAAKLLELCAAERFCGQWLGRALEHGNASADRALDLLCNLSREHPLLVWQQLLDHDNAGAGALLLERLVSGIVLGAQYRHTCCSLDGAAALLQNLSQLATVRKSLAIASTPTGTALLHRLCAALSEQQLAERRRHALQGMLRNLCFDDALHGVLLQESSGLLPALLLPLCGPDDVIDDEDMAGLPMAVRYVPGDPDTCREPDLAARMALCESLMQLCSTPIGRTTLHDNNVYMVLRELHKSETTAYGKLAAERVVDILLNDALMADDRQVLRQMEVPPEMSKRIEDIDKDYLEEPSDSNMVVPV